MGYTHYWYKQPEIDKAKFDNILDDFAKTFKELSKYIDLAGANGEGLPWIDKNTGQVRFNGRRKCGHPQNAEICIPWPAPDAGGVAGWDENKPSGSWFAGAEVRTRMCNGSCDYESFVFDRVSTRDPVEDGVEKGLCFDCCKTAFRPYDLAVITFLIIAKRHLGDKIRIASDGENGHWFDGKMICQMCLGYGLEYSINKEDGTLIDRSV